MPLSTSLRPSALGSCTGLSLDDAGFSRVPTGSRSNGGPGGLRVRVARPEPLACMSEPEPTSTRMSYVCLSAHRAGIAKDKGEYDRQTARRHKPGGKHARTPFSRRIRSERYQWRLAHACSGSEAPGTQAHPVGVAPTPRKQRPAAGRRQPSPIFRHAQARRHAAVPATCLFAWPWKSGTATTLVSVSERSLLSFLSFCVCAYICACACYMRLVIQ